MTRLKSRPFSPRLQWQLEQQGVPSLLARIYAARGVQAKSELDYAAKLLIPPAQLTHAGEAAVLLADALEAQAHILIVADYDCDGATACAVGVRAAQSTDLTEVASPPRRIGLRIATVPMSSGPRVGHGREIGPRCRGSEIAR